MQTMIANCERALAMADEINWWKRVVASPLPKALALEYFRHYATDRSPNEIARRAWGAKTARSQDGRFWLELLSDFGMAFYNLRAALWFIHSGGTCDRDERQPCGDRCTCPAYPCPCGYNPYEYAANNLERAEHYAGTTLERAARLLPREHDGWGAR
jgi:hypothetical protein